MEGSLWNCVTLQPFAPWLPRSTFPKRQPCLAMFNPAQTAALLGYVQSSVSAQIQELEAELGVLLFDRLNRRVILTDEGQRLLV